MCLHKHYSRENTPLTFDPLLPSVYICRQWHHSHGKISQTFLLRFLAYCKWSVGRPGNIHSLAGYCRGRECIRNISDICGGRLLFGVRYLVTRLPAVCLHEIERHWTWLVVVSKAVVIVANIPVVVKPSKSLTPSGKCLTFSWWHSHSEFRQRSTRTKTLLHSVLV